MPDLPLVIFDGHCGFCRIWVDLLTALTPGQFRWAPSQEVGDDYPQIPREQFSKSVQLVQPDGSVESGARAIFRIASAAPGFAWLFRAYEHIPLAAPASEAFYRFIAAHRDFGYQATRVLWGRRIEPASFEIARRVFVRLLALVYLVAFWSFAKQSAGLIGSNGILPLDRYLAGMHQAFGASAWRLAPTLFWFNASDTAIRWLPLAGIAIALLALTGLAHRTCFALLFLLYLSVVAAGQDFMSFQWDYLLLETGLLAIFLTNTRISHWLFRLLLFRLMFFSGWVKLASGDPTWHGLTALTFHYHTQPLPIPLAWYMDQLPLWFQQTSTFLVLGVELGAPLLLLLPRRPRISGAACLIALQVLILTTGNYAFFNWLTIALCLLMFDDQFYARFRVRRPESARSPGRVWRKVLAAVASLIVLLNLGQFSRLFFGDAGSPLDALLHVTEPFGIVNSYGLFASMTTTRPEIVVQGSDDGATWRDYAFPYKPGDVSRRPAWVAPYQPRLDWQMWFAALGNYQSNDWFLNLMVRLLQGSPEVASLFERTPFGNRPPRYVRAVLYEYRFTTLAERHATHAWWGRVPRGSYFPAISLGDIRAR